MACVTSVSIPDVELDIWAVKVVLSSSDGTSILLLRTSDGLELPELRLKSDTDSLDMPEICEQLGVTFASAFCVSLLREEGFRYRNGDFAPEYLWVQNHSTEAEKSRSVQLVTRESLNDKTEMSLKSDELAAIKAFFHWQADQSPSVVPWRQPGWVDETAGWIKLVLSSQGAQPPKCMEQISSTLTSCVLRFPAEDGNTYIKACAPYIPEVSVSAAIARACPNFAPGPFHIEVKQNIMFMKSYGRLLSDLEAPDRMSLYSCVLKSLAKFQLESRSKIPELISAGIDNSSLAHMMHEVEKLVMNDFIVDAYKTRLEYEGEMLDDYKKDLMTLVNLLNSKAQMLSLYRIPATIVHGDLCFINILAPEKASEACKFFDWGYSFIGHPFLDAARFLFEARVSELGADLSDKLRVEDYLESWREFENRERLLDALSLSSYIWEVSVLAFNCRLLESLPPASQWELCNKIAIFFILLRHKNFHTWSISKEAQTGATLEEFEVPIN